MATRTTRAYYLRWIRAIKKKMNWIAEYLNRMYWRAEARKKKDIMLLVTYAGTHLIALNEKLDLLENLIKKGGKREE